MAIRRNGAVYFCAIGGAGALACKCIPECEVIAFEDLGCESVKRLRFEKFPLIVTIDCVGETCSSRAGKSTVGSDERALRLVVVFLHKRRLFFSCKTLFFGKFSDFP